MGSDALPALVWIPMKEIACSDPMSIKIRAQRSWQFHGDGLIDISQEKWVIGRLVLVAAIGLAALFRFSTRLISVLVRFPAALLAHRLAAQLNAIGIVNQPIHNAVGDGGITDLLMPVRNGQLAG